MGDKLLGQGQATKNPFGNPGSGQDRVKFLVIGAIVLVGGALMLQTLRADPTPEPIGITGKPASKPVTLTPEADKEAWLGEAAGRVKNSEMRTQQLEQQLKLLQDEFRRKSDEWDKEIRSSKAPSTIVGKSQSLAPSNQVAMRQAIPPPPQTALPTLPGAVPGGSVVKTGGGMPQPIGTFSPQGVPVQASPVTRIRVVSPDPIPQQGAGPARKYWIPTGTIIPVKLITGLDAPGKSMAMGAQAHPVLMYVEDMSMLPNNVQMDMRECHILGEAIGDLSEERAKIRTRSLSCIKDKEQQVVDIAIHGMVTGEDGKVGFRGPVVTREGALLAKALMAGTVQGLSRAFMPYQQGFMISSSPAQAFQFPDPQRLAMAGAAGAMGGTAQALARHYTQMAKDIYPVIEIDAGRQGSVIITEGRAMSAPPL